MKMRTVFVCISCTIRPTVPPVAGVRGRGACLTRPRSANTLPALITTGEARVSARLAASRGPRDQFQMHACLPPGWRRSQCLPQAWCLSWWPLVQARRPATIRRPLRRKRPRQFQLPGFLVRQIGASSTITSCSAREGLINPGLAPRADAGRLHSEPGVHCRAGSVPECSGNGS